jgi:hypothetical protein
VQAQLCAFRGRPSLRDWAAEKDGVQGAAPRACTAKKDFAKGVDNSRLERIFQTPCDLMSPRGAAYAPSRCLRRYVLQH